MKPTSKFAIITMGMFGWILTPMIARITLAVILALGGFVLQQYLSETSFVFGWITDLRASPAIGGTLATIEPFWGATQVVLIPDGLTETASAQPFDLALAIGEMNLINGISSTSGYSLLTASSFGWLPTGWAVNVFNGSGLDLTTQPATSWVMLAVAAVMVLWANLAMRLLSGVVIAVILIIMAFAFSVLNIQESFLDFPQQLLPTILLSVAAFGFGAGYRAAQGNGGLIVARLTALAVSVLAMTMATDAGILPEAIKYAVPIAAFFVPTIAVGSLAALVTSTALLLGADITLMLVGGVSLLMVALHFFRRSPSFGSFNPTTDSNGQFPIEDLISIRAGDMK
jgi:hypothetical protein